MIVAQWFNTDKTRGARLWQNGVLEVMERENSGCVWSPPNTLAPDNFEPVDDRINLVGVSWIREYDS